MTTTQEKMLPLHEAAKKGYIHCAELLLEKQAVDMNEKNGQGLTPLHLAAMGGHLELVRLLVENGVDIDALTEPQRKTVEEVAKTPEIVAYLHAVRTSQVSVAFDFQDFQNPSFNLLPDALHSGFLWKSSGREKNKAKGWQRRWFVLLPSFVITYFKSPKVLFPSFLSSSSSSSSVSLSLSASFLSSIFFFFFLCRPKRKTVRPPLSFLSLPSSHRHNIKQPPLCSLFHDN